MKTQKQGKNTEKSRQSIASKRLSRQKSKARKKLAQEVKSKTKEIEAMLPGHFLGYSRDRSAEESHFETSDDGLACVVSRITKENLDSVKKETGFSFHINDWVCLSGPHDKLLLQGPFKELEDAFEFARLNFGAVRFNGTPSF